jgi:hypothetical protein
MTYIIISLVCEIVCDHENCFQAIYDINISYWRRDAHSRTSETSVNSIETTHLRATQQPNGAAPPTATHVDH